MPLKPNSELPKVKHNALPSCGVFEVVVSNQPPLPKMADRPILMAIAADHHGEAAVINNRLRSST
ncbi:MAG: hypothetical protein HKL81_06310 [Acidimicrobiaceae bacterium]|nr:hypothetical protein [Acidimicrobiaceae bacterium]